MCHCHTFPERFSPKLIEGLSTTTRTRTTVVMDGEMCRPSAGHGTWVGAELVTRLQRCSAQLQVHTQHECLGVNESAKLSHSSQTQSARSTPTQQSLCLRVCELRYRPKSRATSNCAVEAKRDYKAALR